MTANSRGESVGVNAGAATARTPLGPVSQLRVVVVTSDPLVGFAVARAVRSADATVLTVFSELGAARREIPGLAPDVVLVDVALADNGAVSLIEALADPNPSTWFLLLTPEGYEERAVAALRAGARGLVARDANDSGIAHALDAVRRNEPPLPRRYVRSLIAAIRDGPVDDDSLRMDELTARENQVMRMVVRGMTDRAIATALVLSPRTVESHVASILRKLDAHSRVDAAHVFVRRTHRDDPH